MNNIRLHSVPIGYLPIALSTQKAFGSAFKKSKSRKNKKLKSMQNY